MRPPRSRNRASAPRAGWAVVPPWLTPVFFSPDAAEAHQQIGVLGDHRPVRGALEQVVVRAHHPGHDHPGGAETVGVPRKRVAAKQFEESVHLTLRVVEPARTGPAVGTAVDGLVAVGVDDAAQFAGEQFGEVVPGHRDELVGAAPVARARPVLEPATSDGRAAHPRLVTYRAGQVAQQRRGIGVARWGGDLDDVAVVDAGVEGAPVGEARRDSSSVGDLSHGPSLRRQPAGPDYQPTRRLVYLRGTPGFTPPPSCSGGNDERCPDVQPSSTSAPCSSPSTTCSASPTARSSDRHVAPYHDQWEKDKIVDRGVWLEAGKQGFLGMAVPEEYGGGGNPDFRYNAIVTEETTAGRFSGLGFGLHNDVVAPYLLRLAHRGAEAALAARVLHRRIDHGDRHDRAGHRQRPAGHQDPRGQATATTTSSTGRRRSSPTASTPIW